MLFSLFSIVKLLKHKVCKFLSPKYFPLDKQTALKKIKFKCKENKTGIKQVADIGGKNTIFMDDLLKMIRYSRFQRSTCLRDIGLCFGKGNEKLNVQGPIL